jgi:hypothetical protein
MRKTRKNTSEPGRANSKRIPPGATRKAANEPLNPSGGLPGSGAGPRHAAGDPGSPNESFEATDSNEPIADDSFPEESEPEQQGPPYAGPSGGAVGGTPAEGRSSGGRTGHGIKPGGVHRGDSTIGTDPESGTE